MQKHHIDPAQAIGEVFVYVYFNRILLLQIYEFGYNNFVKVNDSCFLSAQLQTDILQKTTKSLIGNVFRRPSAHLDVKDANQ